MLEALHTAAKSGRPEQVQALLDQDPSLVNALTSDGWNALRVAVSFNQPLVLRDLLPQGAKEAPARKDGWSSLHVACFHGFAECAELLLSAGVSRGVVLSPLDDEDGRWPIHCAVQRDHTEVLEHLLMHRGDIAQPTVVSGCSALHFAARYGSLGCLRIVIDKARAKKALMTVNKRQRTPLQEAVLASCPHTEGCVELILEKMLPDPSSLAPSEALSPHLMEAFLIAMRQGRSASVAPFLRRRRFADLFDVVCASNLRHLLPAGVLPKPTVTSSSGAGADAAESGLASSASLTADGDSSSASTSTEAVVYVTPLHLMLLTFNADFVNQALGLIFETLLLPTNATDAPTAVSSGASHQSLHISAESVVQLRRRFAAAVFDVPIASASSVGPTAAMLLFSAFNKAPDSMWQSPFLCARGGDHLLLPTSMRSAPPYPGHAAAAAAAAVPLGVGVNAVCIPLGAYGVRLPGGSVLSEADPNVVSYLVDPSCRWMKALCCDDTIRTTPKTNNTANRNVEVTANGDVVVCVPVAVAVLRLAKAVGVGAGQAPRGPLTHWFANGGWLPQVQLTSIAAFVRLLLLSIDRLVQSPFACNTAAAGVGGAFFQEVLVLAHTTGRGPLFRVLCANAAHARALERRLMASVGADEPGYQ